MPEKAEVLTDTDTEDSPPEKSDSAPPEESGQEEAIAEAEVGAEETEEPVEEIEEEKPDPLHTHPRFQEVIEERNEARNRAARAETELEVRRQQERVAKPQPVTAESLKAQYDSGELEYDEYNRLDAALAARDATRQENTLERETIANREMWERIRILLPDLEIKGSETNKMFTEIAQRDYGYLFNSAGETANWQINENIAREVKKAQAVSTQKTNAKVSEQQRRESIKQQMGNQPAPDGRDAETTEEHDPMSQLTDEQKAYLKHRGRLNDQGIKDYLRGKKLDETHKEKGQFSSTPQPERARRRA